MQIISYNHLEYKVNELRLIKEKLTSPLIVVCLELPDTSSRTLNFGLSFLHSFGLKTHKEHSSGSGNLRFFSPFVLIFFSIKKQDLLLSQCTIVKYL